MTFSTTAFFGLALFLIYYLLELKRKSIFTQAFVFLFSILVLLMSFRVLIEIFEALFFSKFTKSSQSGFERSTNAATTLDFFMNDFSIFQKVFGIGFGTVRSTDFISTLLVNSGFIGLVVFLFLFMYPLFSNSFSLDREMRFVILFLLPAMLLAVPEFSILSTWYFLGIAYAKKKTILPNISNTGELDNLRAELTNIHNIASDLSNKTQKCKRVKRAGLIVFGLPHFWITESNPVVTTMLFCKTIIILENIT
jgi:hypothetical protein